MQGAFGQKMALRARAVRRAGRCYHPGLSTGADNPLASRLLEAIRQVDDGLILVVTGAGASHASGIPTFRGREPEAVWKQDDIVLATRQTFELDPVAQWRWYLRRFDRLEQAHPNAAHRALVDLERWQRARGGGFLLVTQNIDTLHEEAGSERLIKVHGSSDRLRCSRYGCRNAAPAGSIERARVDLTSFRRRPERDNLPTCPSCGALLRAHVLLFDEMYDEHADYRFGEVQRAATEAMLMIFIGTSFSVGVTDLLVRTAAQRGVPRLSVDPGDHPLQPWAGIDTLAAAAEELLPEVCELLQA
jgi:NAD-dependent deacetylase